MNCSFSTALQNTVLIGNLQIFLGLACFILLPFQVWNTQSCSRLFWLVPFYQLVKFCDANTPPGIFPGIIAPPTHESTNDIMLCSKVLMEWQFMIFCQTLWFSACYIGVLDESPSICSARVKGFVHSFSPLVGLLLSCS